MKRKLDRRVKRTRKMLAEALIALIQEKSYESISITDITEQADLNRATFYLHYENKESLLMDLLKTRFDELVEEMDRQFAGRPYWHTHEPDILVFEHAAEHADMYKVILGVGPVINYVRQYIADKIELDLQDMSLPDEVNIPIPLMAQHVAGSLFAQLIWWLEQDMPYSPIEMAKMAHAMCLQGILSDHEIESRVNI